MSEPRSTRLIRALIVDDSAFARKTIREMLLRTPFIEVIGMARDGVEALDMTEELKPDVITCDMIMPRCGGLDFVRQQMARREVPILLLTSSPKDGEEVMEALDAGAVDFVQKPSALANERLLTIREELAEKVKAAARAQVLRPLSAPVPVTPFVPRSLKIEVVVIGVSTGGPQALRRLIPRMPANFPVPIGIVLHMPVGYTGMFAEKLDELSELRVVEAGDQQEIQPGTVLLAPGGQHLIFRRNSSGILRTHLDMQPSDKPHRPSVDVLFQSAAETFGKGVLGVVMTGMGDDGKTGAACIKGAGGTVLTEAEETCVIYGMPRSVVEAGLSDAAVPLDSLAETILKLT
jgi:two-component system chemotaxis response regulator CheB